MSGVSSVLRDVHELTDPRSLPNLELWLDARYPNGIGSAMPFDGDPLSTWTDLSGKGRHLSQSNAAKRPLWRNRGRNLAPYNKATFEGLDPTTDGSIRSVQGNLTTSYATSPAPVQGKQVGAVTYPAGTYGGYHSGAFSFGQVVVNKGGRYRFFIRYSGIPEDSPIVFYITGASGNGQYHYAIPSAPGDWQIYDSGWFDVVFVDSVGDRGALSIYGYMYTTKTLASPETYYFDTFMVEEDATGTTPLNDWVPPVDLPNASPAVQFDGIDDILSTPTLTIPGNDFTFYSVFRNRATQNQRILSTKNNGERAMLMSSGGTFYAFGYPGAGQIGAPLLGTNTWMIGTNKFESPSYASAYMNGKYGSTGQDAAGYILNTPISVGGTTDNNSLYMNGDMVCSMIFSEAHSDATRNKVERMLSRRYGVAVE